MTDPQIAILMLGLFIGIVFLGFPIAFTLMAMGIGFGYYAYFDAARMWRSYLRLDEGADAWTRASEWAGGFFNNRIFDLFVNQTYSVMSNEVLTAIPLFLFMGYIVERANIVDRLFTTLNAASKKRARLDGGRGAGHLRAVRHGHGDRGRRGDADGAARTPRDAQGALQPRLRERDHLRGGHAGHPDPALDHAHRLCRGIRRLDRAALRGRAAARLHAGRALPRLHRRPLDPAAVGSRHGPRTRRCPTSPARGCSGCWRRASSRSPF